MANGIGSESGKLTELIRVFVCPTSGSLDKVAPMTTLPDLETLRYPIGHFNRPASSMSGIRTAHIHTLRLLPERIKAAVDGLDDHQLDTPYREGGWTVRQVVHHVADSHANGYIRFRLALTEDWPTIKGYNQAAWADLSDARWLPIGISLDLISSLHARWVSLLESLSDSDFHRGYIHNEYGKQNLAQSLASYDWHARHHTAHINQLRQRMGW